MSKDKTKEKEIYEAPHAEKQSGKTKETSLKDLVSDLQNKNARLMADIENQRKMHQQETENTYKYRAAGFIMEVLPTLDMFEMALNAKDVSPEVKN